MTAALREADGLWEVWLDESLIFSCGNKRLAHAVANANRAIIEEREERESQDQTE
jgi:sulfite reductase alpha subunit-like flavoprotein